MSDNGDHGVDGVHGAAPEPDPVTRVEQHRARLAATGAEVHPDAAVFAARLARAAGDPAARAGVPLVSGPAGPQGQGLGDPDESTVKLAASAGRGRPRPSPRPRGAVREVVPGAAVATKAAPAGVGAEQIEPGPLDPAAVHKLPT